MIDGCLLVVIPSSKIVTLDPKVKGTEIVMFSWLEMF